MLQLYYALGHPFLFYGIIIWRATDLTYMKRLKSLQNRAIRAVARCHYRDQVKLFCNQFRILQIDDLLKYEIAKFVYSTITNKTPNSFRNYFCKTAEYSSRVTRQSKGYSNLYIPRYQTNELQRCIKYQGVKIWNSIPQKVRVLSYNRFKIQNKNFLLNRLQLVLLARLAITIWIFQFFFGRFMRFGRWHASKTIKFNKGTFHQKIFKSQYYWLNQ